MSDFNKIVISCVIFASMLFLMAFIVLILNYFLGEKKDIMTKDIYSDGNIYSVGIDTNENGCYNVVAMDSTGDGELDCAFLDTNGDGITDTEIPIKEVENLF